MKIVRYFTFLYRERWRLLVSLVVAVVAMSVAYVSMNSHLVLGSEKMKVLVLEFVREHLFGPRQEINPDSVIMVDVHYDKTLVMERVQGEHGEWADKGLVTVTDRTRLLRLLQWLERRADYRAIMLDVRLEAATSQPHDSALWRQIARMPRLVLATPQDGALASPLLADKAGAAQYVTSVWESDFVKYPFFVDSLASMPLKLYRQQTGRDLKRSGPLWLDSGQLALCSVFLTFGQTDYRGRYYLGELLGQDSTCVEADEWVETDGQWVLIGDFEEDVHPTFQGELPGTLINFNAFLSLMHGRHLLPVWLIGFLLLLYFLLAWLTISGNRQFSKLCSFWGYVGFFTLLCAITYLLFNQVYDILFTTLLFTVLRWGVELWRKRHGFFNFITSS